MTEVKEILMELRIPLVHKKKLIKRYQKRGIEVKDEAVSEEDGQHILRDAKESICLNDYIKEQIAGTEIILARAVSDIRRYLAAEGIVVLRFSDTTFAIRPNTFYFRKDDRAVVDHVIHLYLQSAANGTPFIIRKPQKPEKPQTDGKTKEKKEQEELIGIIDYLIRHDGWEHFARKNVNREKALFYLEDHEYFGIKRVDAEKITFEKVKKNPYYIYKKDIPYLDGKMERFFTEFGLSEREKLDLVIASSDKGETFELYLRYLEHLDITNIQPYIVEGARLLSDLPAELWALSNDEVMDLLAGTSTKSCKSLMMGFANWLRQEKDVGYDHFVPVVKEPEKIKAYTMEEYYGFCLLVFHEEYIREERMVEKALEDIRYAGMWMYHCIHATADIRGTDMEKIVAFLNLKEDQNYYPEIPRDPDRLADMLKKNEIPEDVYLKIGRWFIERILINGLQVNKTNRGEVMLRAVDSLTIHYGRLILIGEVHYMRGSEQFLNVKKHGSFYSGRLTMKAFYGERMGQWLGRANFSRLRMNHTISQIEETTARTMGMQGLTAVSIAGHSRGHTSIGSMLHYVGDHNLTGEDAAVVLWTMMERKVFGAIPYLSLITLYPDSFGKLTREEQTKVLNLSGLTAIDIESALSHRLQMKDFEDTFKSGDKKQSVTVFQTLLAIGQGYGASLDEGCFCTQRARGYACPRKVRGSCIVADCKCNVLTAEAIPSMIRLIREKQEQAEKGDMKALAVLEQRLRPKFKAIRKCLNGVLSEKEMKEVTAFMNQLLEAE
ncbi:MAG: hypothetical protein ACI4EG_12995 [Fusicatenibacter sp.]